MKSVYINTASVFSSDYKSYGFFKTGSSWDSCALSLAQVLNKQNPNVSHFLGQLSNLGERRRICTLWISKAERRSDLIVSCTLTGLESSKRTDFSGRIIYDSINVTYSSLDEQVGASKSPDDVLAIAARFAMSAVDLRWNLDDYADLKSFEADEFPFIDISSMYRGIAVADPMTGKYAFTKPQGLNPVHEIRSLAKSLGLRLENSDEMIDENRSKKDGSCGKTKASKIPNIRSSGIAELLENVEDVVLGGLGSIVGEEKVKKLSRQGPLKWLKSTVSDLAKGLTIPEEVQSSKSSAKPADASPPIHVDLSYHATTNAEAIASLITGIGKIVEDVNSLSILLSVGQDCATEAMKQRSHALPKPSIFISIA
jgi:hypothetical protein